MLPIYPASSNKRRMPPFDSTATTAKRVKETEERPGSLQQAPTTKSINTAAEELICPITLELPFDPVTAADGRVYERVAIEEYFALSSSRNNHNKNNVRSPWTQENMDKKLLPAPFFKNLIQKLINDGVVVGDLAKAWNKRVQAQAENEQLVQEARAGNVKAMAKVGYRLLYGKYGVRKDESSGYEWMDKASKAGSIWATMHVGLCLLEGRGVTTNRVLGIMCLTRAAEQGSDFAAYKMGMAMALGLHGLPVDKLGAIQWVRKSLDPLCANKTMSKAAQMIARKQLKILLILTSYDE